MTAVISERRAYRYLGVARSTVRYQSRRPKQAEFRAWLRALAAQQRRWGYRRLHVLLEREGWAVNHRRVRGRAFQVRRRRWKQVSRPLRRMDHALGAERTLEPGLHEQHAG